MPGAYGRASAGATALSTVPGCARERRPRSCETPGAPRRSPDARRQSRRLSCQRPLGWTLAGRRASCPLAS
eukprot:617437-Alexandrium_andersonii.AAC.1